MPTRRELFVGAAFLAPLAVAVRGAGAASGHEGKGHAQGDKPQFLFVQNAEGVEYADRRLTLKGVSPITTLFSDRPDRIAGHMKTADFIPFWLQGADSFQADPPNATLSVLEGGKDMANVVLELSEPRLAGTDLSYKVKLLEGQPPAAGGAASLFIDIIGMPLTPVSFAGADRRMWRRAVY